MTTDPIAPTPSITFVNWAEESVSLRTIRRQESKGHADLVGRNARFRGGLYWPEKDSIRNARIEPSVRAANEATGAKQRRALENLNLVVTDRPGPVLRTLPTLETLLLDEEFVPLVVETLAGLARTHPHQVVPLLDPLTDALTRADTHETVQRGSQCLNEVAYHSPSSILDYLDRVLEVLDGGGRRTRQQAVRTLRIVSGTHPRHIEEALPEVFPLPQGASERVRSDALVMLGNLTRARPEAGQPYLHVLVDSLSNRPDHHVTLAEAISAVATMDPQLLIPHLPALHEVLDQGSKDVQLALLPAFVSIAGESPDKVASFSETLIRLAESDSPSVQKYACWALGEVGARDAKDVLLAVEATSTDREVMAMAQWALRELETKNRRG